ncbi:hypothetical protein V8B97DRAFT_2025545 [Scleroderma yunnanense]
MCQHLQLQLWQGQANDVLHELWLALVDKSQLFCTNISDVDAMVRRHAAMIALGADSSILDQYRDLEHHDLWVTTAVADPNACGHCNEHLAWFWAMDIPKDTNTNDWMSEYAKSLKDQWAEEMELLSSKIWKHLELQAELSGNCEFHCYYSWQVNMYHRLRAS